MGIFGPFSSSDRATLSREKLDNFLIIGVIAAVRHILTVGASLTMEKEKSTEYFNRALTEMGVNTGIVVALVFALFLSRAARTSSKKSL